MRVAIAGSSGLIGSALVENLKADNIQTVRLVRGEANGPDEVQWDPAKGQLAATALEGCDAVVNLAGENVADGRWTEAKKKRILSSRIDSTRTLVNNMRDMDDPPEVFVCASAIGYYGDQGDLLVDENAPPGRGFLAEVCQAWEMEAARLETTSVRVVRLRTGLVLSEQGGAFPKLAKMFQLGLGGRLGDGQQYMSWISLEDHIRAIRFCISREDIRGPVNATAPHAVTNNDFTRALGKAVHRPTLLPAPAFGLRMVLGEMADEMLLVSQRVSPHVLSSAGFDWTHPKLPDTLRHLLRRPA